jgi:t-SNARE complex subunit (syntaxin)
MDIRARIEKIKTPEDAEKQITLAKQYAMRLRAEAKKQTTLAEKVASQEKVKLAERVMRELRRLIWDIEDVLAAGKPATSVLKN